MIYQPFLNLKKLEDFFENVQVHYLTGMVANLSDDDLFQLRNSLREKLDDGHVFDLPKYRFSHADSYRRDMLSALQFVDLYAFEWNKKYARCRDAYEAELKADKEHLDYLNNKEAAIADCYRGFEIVRLEVLNRQSKKITLEVRVKRFSENLNRATKSLKLQIEEPFISDSNRFSKLGKREIKDHEKHLSKLAKFIETEKKALIKAERKLMK